MENEFLKHIYDTIRQHDMLHSGDRVVVALSGGADSVAVLRALNALAGELNIELFAAHLNHCIRGKDADGDEDFARRLSAELGLQCTIERIDIPSILHNEGGSLEEVARRERYAFLRRTAVQLQANKIAMGHTKDDNIETVLQRILRGAGIRGLAGIPPVRPVARGSDILIVRPLIDVTRDELAGYLSSIGQDFRVDASNEDIAYFRNRLRHVVLPFLESECAGAREALNRLALAARNQYNLIESMARELLEKGKLPGEPHVFDTRILREAHPELVIEALRLAIEESGGAQLSFEQSRNLLDMLDAGTGTEMSLPGGLVLRAEYDTLRIMKPAAAPSAVEIELPVPGAAKFIDRTFTAEIADCQPGVLEEFIRAKTPNEEMLDLDKLRLPLTLRTRRAGDRFHPLGAPGARKLHDFLIDEKAPAWQRHRIPLVCDRTGIICVAGHRIDQRVRVTRDTKRLLKLTMTG